jgi:hypothetical protein
MGYLGYKPADKPLTSADITDGIITSAKITDATIVNGDIANSTIALAKLSATGTASSTTFLRGDNTWGSAGAAAGQVIQVLGATDSTARSTTSTSFVTGSNTLSVTITPSSSANKFIIHVNHYAYTSSSESYYTIFRDSTNLGNSNGFGFWNSNGGNVNGTSTYNYLDSPSTTSAITYQVYFRASSGVTAYLNEPGVKSQIIVMEVKG